VLFVPFVVETCGSSHGKASERFFNHEGHEDREVQAGLNQGV
jgi:hypothetical protein